ncbi:MAG TPA: rod shape-determining protein RodA, partial [Ferruginibacter sp.]|nr:rod shape-determining protein RodA [Ferruginibacter sp.]
MVGKSNPYADEKTVQLNQVDEKAKKKKEEAQDYNVKQSKIAIGSGGFAGKGFLKGTQTQGDFVPEQHTDFIFTSVGENFGFWGTSILMLLYLFLLLRIVRIAERQRSTFSRVYAYSVAGIIFFHVSVNICVTIGLAPVIGITLPLMSYGGSSLLTFTILLFILIKLDADRQMVLR